VRGGILRRIRYGGYLKSQTTRSTIGFCHLSAMAAIFERVETKGIAELSYLIGDDSTHTAAVIDPRADVAIYLDLARKHRLSITHIFETHIHADLISGARELAAQSGSAEIFASVEGGADYGFPIAPVRDGDRFVLGETVLTARHTPGHTPEHVAYEAEEKGRGQPWGVFTGDSLFVASAGRPDLLGKDAYKLASQLYDTLFDYFAKLPEGVIIYPAHGHGSPCGADIGDRLESTIGYEMRFNPYFQIRDRAKFIEHALSTAPPEPTYYKRMKKLNAAGPEVLGRLPVIPALAPDEFQKRAAEGRAALIDTRHMLAFGGGHIAGAINLGATPMLTIWAGWLLDPEQPLLLVMDADGSADEVAALFVRAGYTKFSGYLAGGMTAWQNFGGRLEELPQVPVHEVHTCSDQLQVIDVRAPSEWEAGHIPCARHLFVPDIRERAGELDAGKPLVTYCATGYRASIAASLLRQQGFEDVRTMPGSWTAWQNAGLPVEGKKGGSE
jgi:hydroxyacylglutathione hydrolase